MKDKLLDVLAWLIYASPILLLMLVFIVAVGIKNSLFFVGEITALALACCLIVRAFIWASDRLG